MQPVSVSRALVLVIALLLAGAVHAVDEDGIRVSASLHPCADDSGGVGSCTANEIDIADATQIHLVGSPDSCTLGAPLQVDSIDAVYGLNTGVRYDPLLWIGQRSNDPRDPDPYLDPEDETVGSCYVTSAPESEDDPDLFAHLEGDDNDSCLDISNPGYESAAVGYADLNFDIECQDADGDGLADVHLLITWVQNTNLLCGNGPGEVFGTGAPPKCNYSLIPLDVLVTGLTVAKVIESDAGGTATLDDFNVSVDGEEVDWDDPSSTSGGIRLAATGAGTYTLSETDVAGYTAGAWSCFDQDDEEVPVTNGGHFGGADVTVDEGRQVTCTITNSDDAPTLTLVKSVVNDDGGEAGPGDFTLRLDGGIYNDAPFSSGDSPPVAAGPAYTLSEDPFPGYQDLGVSCFDEGAEEVVAHPVTLALGQVVTCTLTNDDIVAPAPVLTLLKSVSNDNGGEAEPGDFQLRLDGGIYEDAPFSSGDSPPVTAGTPYTLGEDAFPGYAATGVTCFDEGAEEVVPHPVTLADGQVVTCTIGNDDIAPALTLVKAVINDDGGEAEPGDFTLRLNGGIYVDAPFSSGDSPPVVANTAYTLSEDLLPGYDNLGVSCFDEGAEEVVAHPVTLAPGQVVTCTLTNDDVEGPQLFLVKSVTNDNGGDAAPGDFQLRLDGGIYVNAPFTSGDSPPVEAGTPYTLSEDPFAGYENLGVSCFDEGAEEVVPHPVTLDDNQIVTCTIGNDDIAPPLTVILQVMNDDGGTAVAGDWTIVVTADNPSDNGFPGAGAPGTTITIDAGPYSVEATGGPAGYEQSLSADCAGELQVGESAVCTITADDIQPSLTVAKTIQLNDEGPATLGDFDIRVDDVPVAWTNPGSTIGGSELVATFADTYTLSEAALDDYDEGTWSCTDADGEVPVTNGGDPGGADVTVMPGQDVSCGIINRFATPPVGQSLTVRKIIVSDHGRTATLAEFNVAVDGEEVAWSNPASTTGGTQFVTDVADTYTLSEEDLPDYEPGAWACSDEDGPVPVTNGGAFDGADVTVEENQHVLCSITNDDLPPPTEQSLTVTKIIVSDEGGTATVTDFDIRVNGKEIHWWHPDSTTGDTEVVADLPGTYRLSEAEVEGYEEGRWTCSDDYGDVPVSNEGHFSGADVTVELGQHVHCSITNTYVIGPPPGLVVVKVIRSDHGGAAKVGDFGIAVNGIPVPWDDPDSTAGGSLFVSEEAGTYTLSEAEVDGYVEGRWSCQDAKSNNVPVSNDGHFSGADVTVEPGEQVTCTITNADEKPLPDLRVTKAITPAIGDCDVVLGQQLEFAIGVSNAGPGTAEGVILNDHWSWQLKPTSGPDMYECERLEDKDRWLRCKLGNLEPDASKEVRFKFMIGGQPNAYAFNTASVSAYPAGNGNPDDNEAREDFYLVGKLAVEPDCGGLEPAFVGEPYTASIGITGGRKPYEAEIEGDLPAGLDWEVDKDQVQINGCPLEPGSSEFTLVVTDRNGCQDTRDAPALCILEVVLPPDCPLGDLNLSPELPRAGVPTPHPAVLPDESVQKVAVDSERNRYLVGFAYRDHSYGTDPNGPYVDHPGNYDIRVVKYSDMGIEWDKTYDTGNDDYGYAIALDPAADRPGLFVGGGVEVESGQHAWHEALLLEIDPENGCPVGKHFQSAGMGTTSAYYDIATDGSRLYAVGERQRNEQLVGEFGALISIYSHSAFAGPGASCEGDHHIIGYPPPAGPDPALIGLPLIREGGLDPTVAYSVQLPDPECTDCRVLVGGRSEAGGWVDRLEADPPELAPWLTPGLLGDLSVQDLAVTGDGVIVVGASTDNDMRVLGYDWDGTASWAPTELGKGRLRGVALDPDGAFYVVGRSDEENTAGLIFKFRSSGDEIDRGRLALGNDASFTDVAVFGPGNGVIAGRNEESQYDYTWFEVEFECELDCTSEGD